MTDHPFDPDITGHHVLQLLVHQRQAADEPIIMTTVEDMGDHHRVWADDIDDTPASTHTTIQDATQAAVAIATATIDKHDAQHASVMTWDSNRQQSDEIELEHRIDSWVVSHEMDDAGVRAPNLQQAWNAAIGRARGEDLAATGLPTERIVELASQDSGREVVSITVYSDTDEVMTTVEDMGDHFHVWADDTNDRPADTLSDLAHATQAAGLVAARQLASGGVRAAIVVDQADAANVERVHDGWSIAGSNDTHAAITTDVLSAIDLGIQRAKGAQVESWGLPLRQVVRSPLETDVRTLQLSVHDQTQRDPIRIVQVTQVNDEFRVWDGEIDHAPDSVHSTRAAAHEAAADLASASLTRDDCYGVVEAFSDDSPSPTRIELRADEGGYAWEISSADPAGMGVIGFSPQDAFRKAIQESSPTTSVVKQVSEMVKDTSAAPNMTEQEIVENCASQVLPLLQAELDEEPRPDGYPTNRTMRLEANIDALGAASTQADLHRLYDDVYRSLHGRETAVAAHLAMSEAALDLTRVPTQPMTVQEHVQAAAVQTLMASRAPVEELEGHGITMLEMNFTAVDLQLESESKAGPNGAVLERFASNAAAFAGKMPLLDAAAQHADHASRFLRRHQPVPAEVLGNQSVTDELAVAKAVLTTVADRMELRNDMDGEDVAHLRQMSDTLATAHQVNDVRQVWTELGADAFSGHRHLHEARQATAIALEELASQPQENLTTKELFIAAAEHLDVIPTLPTGIREAAEIGADQLEDVTTAAQKCREFATHSFHNYNQLIDLQDDLNFFSGTELGESARLHIVAAAKPYEPTAVLQSGPAELDGSETTLAVATTADQWAVLDGSERIVSIQPTADMAISEWAQRTAAQALTHRWTHGQVSYKDTTIDLTKTSDGTWQIGDQQLPDTEAWRIAADQARGIRTHIRPGSLTADATLTAGETEPRHHAHTGETLASQLEL